VSGIKQEILPQAGEAVIVKHYPNAFLSHPVASRIAAGRKYRIWWYAE
jgi:hypothetical protein